MYQDLDRCRRRGWKVKCLPNIPWQKTEEWYVHMIGATEIILTERDEPFRKGEFRIISPSQIGRWDSDTRTLHYRQESVFVQELDKHTR